MLAQPWHSAWEQPSSTCLSPIGSRHTGHEAAVAVEAAEAEAVEVAEAEAAAIEAAEVAAEEEVA